MIDKKNIPEIDMVVMTMSPLRFVLGKVSDPNPSRLDNNGQKLRKSNLEMEKVVRRIIAHLEEEE